MHNIYICVERFVAYNRKLMWKMWLLVPFSNIVHECFCPYNDATFRDRNFLFTEKKKSNQNFYFWPKNWYSTHESMNEIKKKKHCNKIFQFILMSFFTLKWMNPPFVYYNKKLTFCHVRNDDILINKPKWNSFENILGFFGLSKLWVHIVIWLTQFFVTELNEFCFSFDLCGLERGVNNRLV